MPTNTTTTLELEKPKTTTKRIKVIDALRGFSLLGIIMTHTTYAYLETAGEPVDFSSSGNLSMVDTAIKMGVQVFATGKFYSIFSFLFGLSFFIQLQSAKKKGVRFTKRFVWRLIILLMMGYVHTLLYPRDILQIYALLGGILLFSINWSGKRLLVTSCTLFVLSILATVFSSQLEDLIFPFITMANQYAISNVFGIGKFAFLIPSGRVFVTVALFMLGMYAGKRNIFKDTPENMRLFRKLLFWGGGISIFNTGVVGVLSFSGLSANTAIAVIMTTLMAVQKVALSSFFVAVIVELYKSTSLLSKVLHWLVPVGRAGLTTYVIQSFFIVGFYEIAHGPETIGNYGLSGAVIITLIYFAGQMIFAAWWMSKCSMGPIEWLWRSLTYLKLQPIRQQKQIAVGAEQPEIMVAPVLAEKV